MIQRLIVITLLAAALLWAISYFLLPPPHTKLPTVHYSAQSQPASSLHLVSLQEVSAQFNIHYSHRQSAETLSAISESLAAGVCVLDFDQDGWMDLLLVGGSGHSRHYGKKIWWGESGGTRLLRNKQGKEFVEVSEAAGVQRRHWGTSCAVADLDNDSDPDLILTGYGENLLYENLGNGQFAERSSQAGIANSHWATGAAIADFNQDGLTDLYITNLVKFSKGRRTFEHQKGYATQAVSFSPQLYDAEENALYLNKGNFQFERMDSLANNRFGRSLSAKWHDIDRNGWLDLVVLNDFGTPNQIYLNQGGKHFTAASERSEKLQQSGSRNLLIEDFLNENAVNYFLSRSLGSTNVLLVPDQPNDPKGPHLFLDASRALDLASHRLIHKESWGAIALDINNDGWQDIYAATGLSSPDPDSHQLALAQENELYLNHAGEGFIRLSGEDLATLPASSRGVASIDVDNDGQLELLVANNNARFQLIKSSPSIATNWVGFKLPPSNHEIRKLELRSGSLIQTRRPSGQQSLFSQSDPRIHFGLGNHSQALELLVYNAQGLLAKIDNIQPNHYYQLTPELGAVTPLTYPVSKTKLEQLIMNAAPSQAKSLFSLAASNNNRHAQLLAWQKMSNEDRLQTLKELDETDRAIAEALIKLSLQSSEPALVLQAVKQARSHEWDWSVNWLIPLLKHSSSEIRCEIASTFRHMLDEEEAALRYKFHTVSPLLKALEEGSDLQKRCFLDALAASESKRAVKGILPLIEPGANTSSLTQAHAIRALGLIRDSSTIEPLLEVRQASTSPEVVANILVALKRLAYQDPKTSEQAGITLNLTQQLEQTQLGLREKLKVMEWLQVEEEGLVFASSALKEASEALLNEINASNRSTALLKQAYRMLATNQELTPPPYLSAVISDPKNLPESALASLRHPSLGPTEPISTQPPARVLETFEVAKALKIKLPSGTVDALFDSNKLKSLHLLTENSHLLSSRQLRLLILKQLQQESSVLALTQLMREAIERDVPAIPIEDLSETITAEQRLSYLHWFYHSPPVTKNATQQLLRARVATHSLLQSTRLSQSEKLALLTQASRHDPDILTTLLYNNETISTPELLSIFSQVKLLKPSLDLSSKVNRVLASADSPLEHKLNAATILAQLEPERIEQVIGAL